MKPSEFSSPAKSFWTAANCQQFAYLCESMLNEVSTAIDLMKRLPAADVLLKELHKKYKLPHDVQWESVKKPNWSMLKKSAGWHNPSWILFAGPEGSAAVSTAPNTEKYIVNVVTAGDTETHQYYSTRGDDIMATISDKIGGRPTSIWQAITDTTLYDKQKKRMDLIQRSQVPGSRALEPDEIAVKFRPLMQRAIRAAIADIQGFAIMQLKNNNRAGVLRKLERIDALEAMAENLEGFKDNRMPNNLVNVIMNAVSMTAAYYYPDMTGGLDNNYRRSTNRSPFSVSVPDNNEGVQQLLKDLHAGDTKKLGTVLAFFKRSLLA